MPCDLLPSICHRADSTACLRHLPAKIKDLTLCTLCICKCAVCYVSKMVSGLLCRCLFTTLNGLNLMRPGNIDTQIVAKSTPCMWFLPRYMQLLSLFFGVFLGTTNFSSFSFYVSNHQFQPRPLIPTVPFKQIKLCNAISLNLTNYS